MVERPVLTASGEVLLGETPEDGIIAKFYGDPDLARTAAQSINAFAALAEHLGREDLNVDLVALVEAAREAERVLKFAFEEGALDEDTIMGLCIDPYGVLADLRQAIPHDTVDRADIGHKR